MFHGMCRVMFHEIVHDRFHGVFQIMFHGSDCDHLITHRLVRKDNAQRIYYGNDGGAKFRGFLHRYGISAGPCWGGGFTNSNRTDYERTMTAMVNAFAEKFPDTPIVAFCSGNDIYWDKNVPEVDVACKHGTSNFTCDNRLSTQSQTYEFEPIQLNQQTQTNKPKRMRLNQHTRTNKVEFLQLSEHIQTNNLEPTRLN